MYVCICNAVTDRKIREAANSGTTTLAQLRAKHGVPGDCGRCARHAHEILREVHGHRISLSVAPPVALKSVGAITP
jgi:bacterioferritin-associated ferredoxin